MKPRRPASSPPRQQGRRAKTAPTGRKTRSGITDKNKGTVAAAVTTAVNLAELFADSRELLPAYFEEELPAPPGPNQESAPLFGEDFVNDFRRAEQFEASAWTKLILGYHKALRRGKKKSTISAQCRPSKVRREDEKWASWRQSLPPAVAPAFDSVDISALGENGRREYLQFECKRRLLSPGKRLQECFVRPRTCVDARGHGIFDPYVLASAVQSGSGEYSARSVDASHNALSSPAMRAVVQALPEETLTQLDVSWNRDCGQGLAEGLARRKLKNLRTLLVAGVRLTSNACLELVDGLVLSRRRMVESLVHLDASHNAIGELGCAALSFLLQPDIAPSLRHLLLAWNNVTSSGAIHLLVPLVRRPKSKWGHTPPPSRLKTLDLSFNNVFGSRGETADVPPPKSVAVAPPTATSFEPDAGKQQLLVVEPLLLRPASVVQVLSEVFRTNTSLEHVALSGNNITPAGAKALGKALRKNTTIVGLHLDDSCCSVDARGRLVARESPHMLVAPPGKGGGGDDDDVSVVAVLDRCVEHANATISTLVGLPPTVQALDDEWSCVMLRAISGVPFIATSVPRKRRRRRRRRKPEPEPASWAERVPVDLQHVVDATNATSFLPARPRAVAVAPVAPSNFAPEASCFADRAQDEGSYLDTDKRLQKCFTSDWAKIESRIRALACFRATNRREKEIARAKDALWPGFRALRAAFCYYAAQHGKAFQLSSPGFAQIWKDSGLLVDGEGFSIADCNNLFLAVNRLRGDRDACWNRHELLEGTIRVAVRVFYDARVVDTAAAAIEMLLAQHVHRVYRRVAPEPDDFRSRALYAAKTDAVIADHFPELNSLFVDLVAGFNPYVDLETWTRIFFFDGGDEPPRRLCQTDYVLVFVHSKLTPIDERHARRNRGMSFLDFVEGVWRLACLFDRRKPAEAFGTIIAHLRSRRASGPGKKCDKSKALRAATVKSGDTTSFSSRKLGREDERPSRDKANPTQPPPPPQSPHRVALAALGLKRAVAAFLKRPPARAAPEMDLTPDEIPRDAPQGAR
ncbi:hypothetical protein CTAYLR_004933 [Chrysophaeum taylorii]|uniref:Uncharacterized protein n=1 Tax=Chrysophaeum taylorii TaxID=2483200 RepID=A0AAD7UNL7_9STRA|nr:hypothetical protein CTAYLR_004933 [Chrysophaeum taylorii]